MCDKFVSKIPFMLKYSFDRHKTQEMCDNVMGNDYFQDDDPKTVINVRLMSWCNIYKQHKPSKKGLSKELMPASCHSARWWVGASQKMKKGNRTIFDWRNTA